MNLQSIKDAVAVEAEFGCWGYIETIEQELEYWPTVCHKYAVECCKASLQMAAKNAEMIYCNDTYEIITLNEASIIDENNIITI